MVTHAGWLIVIQSSPTHRPVTDVFVFLGSYANEDEAQADYDVVKERHRAGRLSSYDAALLTRDAFGQVHIEKDELPTRHGAWTGAAVGALVGLLLPPTALASGAVGAAVPLSGHFRHGLSDADLREFGDVAQIGQMGLVVVADSKVGDLLDERLTGAIATVEKVVAADANLVEALKQSSTPSAAGFSRG
jgi:uncharacterized membrane protein